MAAAASPAAASAVVAPAVAAVAAVAAAASPTAAAVSVELAAATAYLSVDGDRRIAYERHPTTAAAAAEHTFVCLPSLGDVRQECESRRPRESRTCGPLPRRSDGWRLVRCTRAHTCPRGPPRRPADRRLLPLLRRRGDVVTVDLRGLGGSDVGFASYTPEDTGRDVVALVTALRLTRVVLVVCSMSGASAVWATTELPAGTVAGVAFLSPFTWDHPISAFVKFQVWAFLRPWCGGAGIWAGNYRSLHPLKNVDDIETYCAGLQGNLEQAGRLDVVRAQVFASKASCAARLPAFLAARVPFSVVYGSMDHDFPDVAAEARDFTARYTAAEHGVAPTEVAVFEGAGHYPHTERPAETMAIIDRLLTRIASRGGTAGSTAAAAMAAATEAAAATTAATEAAAAPGEAAAAAAPATAPPATA